jgi:hypothetical protein
MYGMLVARLPSILKLEKDLELFPRDFVHNVEY